MTVNVYYFHPDVYEVEIDDLICNCHIDVTSSDIFHNIEEDDYAPYRREDLDVSANDYFHKTVIPDVTFEISDTSEIRSYFQQHFPELFI